MLFFILMRKILKIINSSTLWIFLFCSAIVIYTQFVILKPILKYSLFTGDDWMWLMNFRSLTHVSFFEKVFLIWTKIDIREGAYVAYIGILGATFGNNYFLYQYVTIIFKIIATLTLFPLILILFRSRLLAFLTTIIYGINSASTGSFYWYMKGGIFPAIALMNLFFISLYFTLLRNSRILLFLSSALIFLAYLISPTRIFPIFLIVSGVEIYWLHKHKLKIGIQNSVVRLIFLLLPSVLISLLSVADPTGRVESTPHTLLKQIVEGNWFNLLSPLQGIGFSLLTYENMKIFGHMDVSALSNMNNYLVFLFKGSFWIFLFSFVLLAFFVSKKPLRFIVIALSLNFVLDILMFYIAGHHLFIPHELIQKTDPSLFSVTKNPTLVAIFIFVVAFMTYIEWLEEKKNYLLTAVFIGPIFSFIFLTSMWLTIGDLLDGYNSIHYYYQVPAIGISLFLASILVLFYEKFKKKTLRFLELVLTIKFKKKTLRFLGVVFIIGIIFGFYQSNSFAINREFLGIYSERVEVKDQQILHDKLLKKLGSFDKEGNILVYFELQKDSASSKYYKRSLFLDTQMFGDFIHWRSEGNGPHCIGNISSIDNLRSSLRFKDGRWAFISSGRCLQKPESSPIKFNFNSLPLLFTTLYSKEYVFYSIDDFYAYKIDKGEFVDIKDNLLKKLNLP